MPHRPWLLLVAAAASACTSHGTEVLGRSPVDLPYLIAPRTMSFDGGLVTPPERPLRGYVDFAKMPEVDVVQLHLRPSFFARRWAVHPYFVTYRAASGSWDQWEVWAGEEYGYRSKPRKENKHFSDGTEEVPTEHTSHQYGTIRREENVTYFHEHSPEMIRASWTGDDASRILNVLERPEDYPWKDTYRIWPGPNSNTYAAWVLEQAGTGIDLNPKMVGKDWRRFFGAGVGLSPTRTGLRIDLPGVGAAVGLGDGVELHLGGATLGLDLWPPAIKTPIGRLGFQEP